MLTIGELVVDPAVTAAATVGTPEAARHLGQVHLQASNKDLQTLPLRNGDRPPLSLKMLGSRKDLLPVEEDEGAAEDEELLVNLQTELVVRNQQHLITAQAGIRQLLRRHRRPMLTIQGHQGRSRRRHFPHREMYRHIEGQLRTRFKMTKSVCDS